MDEWKAVIRNLAEHLLPAAPPQLPSLREAGCSDEQIREFAAAAAEFYQAKLWETLDDVDLIKIETPKPPRHLRYAVVLGAGGQSYGLGLYEDAEDHYAAYGKGSLPARTEPVQLRLRKVLPTSRQTTSTFGRNSTCRWKPARRSPTPTCIRRRVRAVRRQTRSPS